jgi:hypothetical protein
MRLKPSIVPEQHLDVVHSPGMEAERPKESLQRELYWAQSPAVAVPSRTTAELRERLVHLAQTLRRDAEQAAPWGDPGLTSGGRWKRRLKILLHRAVRPISRRYDRITAELAASAVALADAVLAAESDVRRLEDEVLALGRRLESPSKT